MPKRKVVTKTEQISYFSRVETADEFSRSALVEWHRRGGENAVVAVQDGALDGFNPSSIIIVPRRQEFDFAHEEYREIHGTDTDTFRQWYTRMTKQLGRQPPQRTNELDSIPKRERPFNWPFAIWKNDCR